MVGLDPPLAYLIGRYAKLSGYTIALTHSIPRAADVWALKPKAILFTSVEGLESAQSLIPGLVDCDIPVLVCSSITDEARALELGADYCLFHPLTYDTFTEALTPQLARA